MRSADLSVRKVHQLALQLALLMPIGSTRLYSSQLERLAFGVGVIVVLPLTA